MATPKTLEKEQKLKQMAEANKKNQHLIPLSQSLAVQNQLGGNYANYRSKGGGDLVEKYNPVGQHFNSSLPAQNYRQKRPIGGQYVQKVHYRIVEKMPAEHPFDEYVLEPDNVYTFSGELNSLGAHYPCDILIDGFDYKSIEHYYQACKLYSLAGSEYAAQLKNIENPLKAKTKANNILRALLIEPAKITEWKEQKGYFMYRHACIHKFVQHENLRTQLLDTENKILAQAYTGDSLFACGMNADQLKKWAQEKKGTVMKYPEIKSADDFRYIPLTGRGKNLYGIVLMEVRKMIRAQKNENVTVGTLIPDLYSSMNILNLNQEEGKENAASQKEQEENVSVSTPSGTSDKENPLYDVFH